jgi:hypothetical protein
VKLKKYSLILSFLSVPYIIYSNNIDKKATVTTLILLFLIFLFKNILFSNKNFHFQEQPYKNVIFIFYIFLLLVLVLITQNSYLNIETIEWDTSSYLVASQEITNGFIPNETQWESKGPLFLYMYNFISESLDKNYLLFRIFNDLLLWVIAIVLFLTSYLRKKELNLPLITSVFFVIMMSQTWAVSEYSELYSLIFISLSNLIFAEKRTNKSALNICGVLISFSTLINQGTIIFLIPYLLYLLFEKRNKLKKISLFFLSFSIPHLFFLFMYFQKNLLEIYLATYITIPLGYSGASFANIYELKVFIRKFYEYDTYLYVAVILVIIFSVLNLFKKNIKINKLEIKNISYINVICSLLFYFIASHNYYHHLIFLLFFISLIIMEIRVDIQKIIISLLVIFSSFTIFTNNYENSIRNLKSVEEVYDNYPLRALSKEIDSYFEGEYTILALDYVLILYYLDKPNYSYIVHPSNHYELFITDTLKRLNLISGNHISDMINELPDVIICNPAMIVRGVPTKIDYYNCAVNDYYKFYKKLDTTEYLRSENLNYYYDPYKEINVFIKQGDK